MELGSPGQPHRIKSDPSLKKPDLEVYMVYCKDGAENAGHLLVC